LPDGDSGCSACSDPEVTKDHLLDVKAWDVGRGGRSAPFRKGKSWSDAKGRRYEKLGENGSERDFYPRLIHTRC